MPTLVHRPGVERRVDGDELQAVTGRAESLRCCCWRLRRHRFVYRNEGRQPREQRAAAESGIVAVLSSKWKLPMDCIPANRLASAKGLTL